MTTPAIPRMGLLAEALARYESGVLVHGHHVTDLATGFSLSIPAEFSPSEQQFGAGGAFGTSPSNAPGSSDTKHPDQLRYRGSHLRLRELDDLTELVHQVVQQRRHTNPNPLNDPTKPRDHFPYGIDVAVPDVLVSGQDANLICRYLRSAGFKARPVDSTYAMNIASQYALATQELRALGIGDGEDEPPAKRKKKQTKPRHAAPQKSMLAHPLVAAAVAIFVLAGAAIVGLTLDGSGAKQDAETVTAAQADERTGGNGGSGSTGGDADPKAPAVDADSPPPFTPPVDRPEMKDHKIHGKEPNNEHKQRADVPMTADLPDGWHLTAATPQRETYTTDKDEGMRVLLAGKPAPLRSQEELDKAVLDALTRAPGTQVARESPVSYREKYPDSETLWHVRLVKGHQVSIGCQYREPTPTRSRVCEQFVNSASPE